MKRPYLAIIVVAFITLQTLMGGGLTEFASDSVQAWTNLVLRFAVGVLGLQAGRAMWHGRPSARAVTFAWAGAVLAHVVMSDVFAGFTREGLPQRLGATVLIAAVLLLVALRARTGRADAR